MESMTDIPLASPRTNGTGDARHRPGLPGRQGGEGGDEYTCNPISTRTVNFGIPTNQEAKLHVHAAHGHDSWNARVVGFWHARPMQLLLMALLLLDVLILFCELFLLAAYPTCHLIERDAISCCPVVSDGGTVRRRLEDHHNGTAHHLVCPNPNLEASTNYAATCDPHKWHRVHTSETVLFAGTMTILSIFLVELGSIMMALTPCVFFRQVFYVFDFIIVSVSFAMELTFHLLSEETEQSIVGLLIIFRLWRFVRIGHGIVEVAAEVSHAQHERVLEYCHDLEDLLQQHDIDLPASAAAIHRDETDDGATATAAEQHHK